MLQLIRQRSVGLKNPAYASFALAFASFGDAFLYPFLPQYGGSMGIPIMWIGFLLAINRFVRIVFNPIVPRLFAQFGIRQVTIAASLLAVVSTLGYGLNWGLLSFALFRVVWGLSFSILRTSTLAYALEHSKPGKAMGIGKSIQEIGPMTALWIGPLLLNVCSGSSVFYILAALSIPSLVFSLRLAGGEESWVSVAKPLLSLPSLLNTMTFTLSFIAEGIIVVTAGLLLTKAGKAYSMAEVTLMAASYLAYRRLCSVLLSPVAGAIADKFGFATIFNGSAAMIVLGLILVLCGFSAIGLLFIFAFNSVNSAMAPGGVATNAADKIKAISVNATWRDTGVAVGTLTGGLLLNGTFLYETVLITTFILAILLLIVYEGNRAK